jgi:tight adherence protein B
MTRPVRHRAAAVGLVVALCAVVGLGPAAFADSSTSSSTALVQVRAVDALKAASTSVQYFDTGSGAGAPPTIVEDGKNVSAGTPKALPAGTSRCIAVVFDTSTAAETSSSLVSAKAALKSWIHSRTGDQAIDEQFAIYAASDTGVQLESCTADASKLSDAIDNVAPPSNSAARNKSAIWSAIALAASGLSAAALPESDLVVVAAQGDNASHGQKDSAIGDVASADAAVFSMVWTGGGYGGGDLKSLSETYGGQQLTTTQGAQMGTLMSSVQSTVDKGQFTASYASDAKADSVVNMTLTSHGQSSNVVYIAGTSTTGWASLDAAANTAGKGGVSMLQGTVGLLLAVVLVLVAVAMFAYGVFLLVTRDSHLTNVLQPYSEGYGPEDDFDAADDGSYAKTAIIQRAVEVTEQFADSQGYLSRAEASLERANLPLRAGEAIFFYAAIVVIATIIGFALGGFIIGLVVGGIAALIPLAAVSFLANRRRKAFLALLPDTLQLLSGTLRAGYSLMQGVEAISQEVEDPMGQELRRVVTEARLGRPLEEALEGVAERMDSPDFSWTVMAIRIQREVGGNLSELLLTVADTMTQRERLRRDVAALTAEGRISAIVLACLPIGLGVMMYVINPTYMSKLFNDTLGNIMLGLALLGMFVGFVWMKKIIDIEI